MARTLDETLAKVTEGKTKTESLIALFAGLKQQLADVLAGVSLPLAVQQKVDAIFDQAAGAADEVDAAIATNVPPTQGGTG